MRAPAAAAHRVLPFWVLQAGQLGAAGALVDLSIHLARPQLLLALACLLAGVALLADAPLGVVRVLPRKPAAILAVAVSVAAVPAMLAPPLRPGVEGAVIVVFVAIGIARLATLTRLAVGPGPEARPGAAPGDHAEESARDGAGVRSGGGETPPADGGGPGEKPIDGRGTGAAAARRLGVEAARLAIAAERRRPEIERAARRLARRAGRATGRVQGRLRDPEPDGDGQAEPPAGPVIGKN